MTVNKNLMNQLTASRLKTNELLGNISDEQMTLPIPDNVEGGKRFNTIREVFYTLITHEIEHTIHLAKILTGLNVHLSEAKLILKELQESRGKLESLIITLEDTDLDRKPSGNEWSPREIIHHLLRNEEEFLSNMIIQAITNQ